jgi:acetolactate synthase-1/3 small subunit
VVDVSPNFFTIEVTGDEGKIRAILDLLSHLGIVEVVRTGKVAIARSRKNSAKK